MNLEFFVDKTVQKNGGRSGEPLLRWGRIRSFKYRTQKISHFRHLENVVGRVLLKVDVLSLNVLCCSQFLAIINQILARFGLTQTWGGVSINNIQVGLVWWGGLRGGLEGKVLYLLIFLCFPTSRDSINTSFNYKLPDRAR